MSDTFWLLVILTGLLSAFTIVRHTRQDEEAGRGELLSAVPIGSHATLPAALLFGAAMNVILAGAFALVLVASDLPAGGALAFGAAIGATGLAFVGVGAVTAQMSPSARAANAASVAVIGAAYVLRATGDALGQVDSSGTTASSAWPSWLSPVGWAQRVGAFVDDDWRPLGLSAVAFAAASAVAMTMLARRDFGHGLFSQRLGPPAAPAGLLRPFGVALRMQRGTLIGWTVGIAALGGVFGSVGTQVDDLASNETFLDLLAGLGASGDALADTYLAAAMALIGAVVACYPLQAVLRLGAEEAEGRLEPVLATATGRTRWLAAHLVVTTAAVLALLTLAGGSAGLLYGLTGAGVPTELASLVGAALAQAPSVLALGGLAVLALGLLPRWSTALTWAAALLLGPLGDTLGLPDQLRDLSPFTHAPAAPAAAVTAAPLLALSLAALALATLGALAFHRRDLALRA